MELDQMEFYRIEYMIQNYEEFLEEEKKEYSNQEKEQGKTISAQQKKMNIPKFKTPAFKTPEFKIPKM